MTPYLSFAVNMMAKNRIPSTDRFNFCGVSLWTMNIFQKIGYMRPKEYDTSAWLKILYHTRTLAFISTHLRKTYTI